MHTSLVLPPFSSTLLRSPSSSTSLAAQPTTSLPTLSAANLSCASSLKTSSSFSSLSFVSSTSSITTMATTLSAVAPTDMFEQLFQRLEEESEQRAREEEEREMLEGKQTTDSTSTIRSARDRRRGSISISRYGQPTELDSRPTSGRASRTSSIIVPKPTFYQLDSRLQHPPLGSTDSFASDTTSDPSLDHVEDEQQVAQTHIIPGQSLSKAISRRLSRARETVPLAIGGALVIGVAVEANTVEHQPGDVHPPQALETTTTTIYSNTLRTQRSSPGLREPATFFAKAKDITARFRRRSVAALTPALR